MLAESGYESQQTDEPDPPDLPNNLNAPVDQDADHGAHGAFDDQARDFSWQLWTNTHRGAVTAAAGGIAALAGLAGLATRRS